MRRFVEGRLRDALGPKSAIRRLHVVPGRLWAEIEGLAVEGPGYRLEAPRIAVKLSPDFLLGRDFSLQSLRIESPQLVLWPTPTSQETAAPDETVLIQDVTVTDGTIVYRQEPSAGEVTLRHVGVTGSVGQGALEIAATGGRWDRPRPLSIGPVRARVGVSQRLDLRIDSFDAAVEDSRVHLAGALGRVGAIEPDLGFEAHLNLQDLRSLEGAPPMSGDVSATGRVAGKAEALRAEVSLGGQQLRISDWRLDRAQGRVSYVGPGRGKTEASFSLDLLGGHARADVRLDGSAASGQVRIAGLDIAELDKPVSGDLPVRGSLSGEVTVQGDLDSALNVRGSLQASGRAESDLALRAQANVSGRVRPQEQVVDLFWTATVNGEPLRVQESLPRLRQGRLAAQGQAKGRLPPAVAGTIEGSIELATRTGPETIPLTGSIRTEGEAVAASLTAQGLGGEATASLDMRSGVIRRLIADARSINLASLVPETTGQASITLQASGPTARMSGSAEARIDNLSWREAQIGTVAATLEGTEGRGRLRLDVPALNVRGEGTVQGGNRPRLDVTLNLRATSFERFALLLDFPLEGQLSGVVNLDIPLSRPEAAQIQARVESLEAKSGELWARTTRPFTATYRDRRVSVEGLELSGPGVALTGSGSLGLGPAKPLQTEAEATVNLAQLPMAKDKRWRLEGEARAQVSGSGTLSRPWITGLVSARDIVVAGPGWPQVTVPEARVDLAGDTVTAPGVTAEVAGGSVTLAGRVPVAAVWPKARAQESRLAPGERAEVRLVWKAIQAGSLLETFKPQEASAVTASLSGEAQLEGGLASLREMRGRISMPATPVHIQELDLQVAPLNVSLQEGEIRTDGLALSAAGGSFHLNGGADVVGRRVEAAGRGKLELRALSPFIQEASVTGTAQVDLVISGSLDDPGGRGSLRIEDATLRPREIRQPITSIQATVVVDQKAIRLEQASGVLGGGTITMTGTARLDKAAVEGVRVEIAGRDLALRYPVAQGSRLFEELKTRLDADLTLTGRPGNFLLSGSVIAERSLYDADIFLERGFLAPEVPPEPVKPSRFLQSVGLDLEVVTQSPLVVRNNIAELEASGRLNIRGDMDVLAPFGRLEIHPGGKVIFQGRTFIAEEGGSLIYRGTLDPEIAIRAEARITDQDGVEHQVTVVAKGTLERPEIDITAPRLSTFQANSLVVTGRTDASLGRGAWIVGEQAASLLAGRVTNELKEGLLGFGFDEVEIRPELLAREEDPGARFTFGKRVSSRVKLVYSVGLNDAERQYYQGLLRFRPGNEVSLKTQRAREGGHTYSFGQRVRFGGGPRRQELIQEKLTTIQDVRFQGNGPFPEAQLRRWIRTEAADKVTYWDLLKDADRLRENLVREGYLEAVIDTRLEEGIAIFGIRSGARYEWRVEGMSNPPDLTAEIRAALYREEAMERGRERLLEELRNRGHLRAEVNTEVVPEADKSTIVFHAEPGPILTVVEVRFPGASALSQSKLLEAAGGAATILLEPEEAQEGIEAAYRQEQYLQVETSPPRVSEEGGQVRIDMPVFEGLRAVVSAVRFEGSSLPEDDLRRLARIEVDAEYDPLATTEAAQRLREEYFQRGYPAVRVTPRLVPSGGNLEIVFEVAEGERQVVGSISVSGLSHTRESLVRGQITLKPGDPLDPRKLAELEGRLLELGIFSRAAVTASDDSPAAIKIELEEDARYRVLYDLRYNDTEGGSALLDGEVGNLLGRGLSVGARYRLGRRVRETRGSFHLPSLWRIGDLTGSVFRKDEDAPPPTVFELRPGEEPTGLVNTLGRGFELQQALHFAHPFEVLYGYRFTRRTISSAVFPPVTLDIAGITASALLDARDNPLNPRRGTFTSLSFEFSPGFLGSDFTFVKGFAQTSLIARLSKSLYWAHGYRVGLGKGFKGQKIIFEERFRAGGPNSLRGYGLDSLGPRNALGRAGGEAVVIANQELRFMHRSGLGAALFYDVGNVYDTIADIDFDLLHTIGAGFRYESPVGLLRVDFGIPLSRRAEDKAFRIFFGLGQAF